MGEPSMRAIVRRVFRLEILAVRVVVLVGLLWGMSAGSSVHAQQSALVPRRAAILAPDRPAFLDNFGLAVAVDGDTALIGAFGEDGTGELGAAYIFERDAGGRDAWSQVAKLIPAEGRDGIQLGWAVALHRDTALVGAVHFGEAAEAGWGSAYVFERDAGGEDAWGQVARLTPAEHREGDRFGYTVALSEDAALVGTYSAGPAYVFARDRGGEGAWGEAAKLTPADAAGGSSFGNAVALSGSTALVGAYFANSHGTASGAAYVFDRDEGGSGAWGQTAKLTQAGARLGDTFGRSVALDGSTAVVGAASTQDRAEGRGSAFVFERDGDSSKVWREVATLAPADGATDLWFGTSVAVSEGRAIVGAHREAEGFQGATYVYERGHGDGPAWAEVARMDESVGAYGDLGLSVSLSGGTAVLGGGVDRSRAPGFGYGTAYVFYLDGGPGQIATATPTLALPPPITPTPSQTRTATPSATATATGDAPVIGEIYLPATIKGLLPGNAGGG